ncbi:MAG: Ribosomal protein L4 [Candidatus Methanohalarchaeum thermophilum]|uniref:50S ribosomal protein L4 n=1 Tax=Methanohalarchaeum thermophilum TaxID=1903181 RepID=A0A1Q6DX02_METT1|nr:MAG: Ribosomal protein L4 [Candidatus Methanohalarchaeum thermophilum]
MTKVKNVYGEDKEEIKLPEVFNTEFRPDLIKKSVIAAQNNRKQPYGSDERAGKRTTAESWGAGQGAAMVPRVKDGRRAALVPQTVGGRRAHPPKSQKDQEKAINKKERRKALKSAIGATKDLDLIEKRGHEFEEAPIIVENEFQALNKTSEVKDFLESVGAYRDIKRSKKGRKRKKRGGYRTPKSILVIYGEDEGIERGARNLPGVDIVEATELSTELLAPGAEPGRLTVWTVSALDKVEEVYE